VSVKGGANGRNKVLVGVDPGCRSLLTAHFDMDKGVPFDQYPNKHLAKYCRRRERLQKRDPGYQHKIMSKYIREREDELTGPEWQLRRVKAYAHRRVGEKHSNKKDLKVSCELLSACLNCC
jgi:hypothetical protein